MAFLLRRYALVTCFAVYVGGLILLHALHLYPRAGLYDISHLIGEPVITFEGRVLDFPVTRWGQTRFLAEGSARPLTAFRGRAAVTLRFPFWDLAPGEIVRMRGWLRRPQPAAGWKKFDQISYWSGKKTYALFQVWSPDGFERLSPAPRGWRHAAWTFHQRFKEFWFDRLSAEEAALVCCMAVGSRGILPARLKDACRRAGVYHILVVSGQQVAWLVALGLGILRLIRLPRRWSFWICIPILVFYAAVVGEDPPVVRAVAMAFVGLAMVAWGRDIPRIYLLIWAGWWILLRDPAALFDASFQLSFGAVLSLFTIFPLFQAPLTRCPRGARWILEAMAVSLSVYIGIWPFLLYYFHQLSIIGFVANWTVFPLAACVMVCGLVVGMGGVFLEGSLIDLLIQGMHGLLHLLVLLIEQMSGWRWAAVSLPAPPVAVCWAYYGLLICVLAKVNGI